MHRRCPSVCLSVAIHLTRACLASCRGNLAYDFLMRVRTDTVSCVRADGCDSEWFPVNSGVRQGCAVAPDTFLVPMDWLLERTVHRGMGTSVGKAIFTDLDFADDVALLTEMLSVLVMALEVMNEEAQPLGLTINWAKTKIQNTK